MASQQAEFELVAKAKHACEKSQARLDAIDPLPANAGHDLQVQRTQRIRELGAAVVDAEEKTDAAYAALIGRMKWLKQSLQESTAHAVKQLGELRERHEDTAHADNVPDRADEALQTLERAATVVSELPPL